MRKTYEFEVKPTVLSREDKVQSARRGCRRSRAPSILNRAVRRSDAAGGRLVRGLRRERSAHSKSSASRCLPSWRYVSIIGCLLTDR